MFKNARLYRLGQPFTLGATELDGRLTTRRFRPCGPVETATVGWCAPLGEDTAALVHGAGDCLLLCLRKQERLLPSSAVAEAIDERVTEIEAGEAREVGRAERRRIKEQIVNEMLPRAFTRSRRTMLYIDTRAGWLVVDSATEKQAEEAVSLLRQTLESLPARPPEPERTPAGVLTAWLMGDQTPADFVLGDTCELRDMKDTGCVIRASGQDLASEEIVNHVRAGKQVVKLAIDWDEGLRFLLAEDLSIKRLKLDDALVDEIGEAEDAAARVDAELALLTLQMRKLIERLSELFALGKD